MTPQEKQFELERHKAILLATLDYLEENMAGSFVCDEFDPLSLHYQQQKLQTEKYFKLRRLDRLQQQLKRLTQRMYYSVDLNFENYVKQKTGYDIGLFESLQKHITIIFAQNEIRNEKELEAVCSMLSYFEEISIEGEKNEKLRELLLNYDSKERLQTIKTGHSKVISSVEKEDGTVEETIVILSGPKPKHFEEQLAISPDGKRKVHLTQWSDKKNSSTYITVQFPTSSGAVYEVSEICPDVIAWWKDNNTIVIETQKKYQPNMQARQVRSFKDIITIEYIER